MKDTRQNINYGLLGMMIGGCLPSNRLESSPKSQQDIIPNDDYAQKMQELMNKNRTYYESMELLTYAKTRT